MQTGPVGRCWHQSIQMTPTSLHTKLVDSMNPSVSLFVIKRWELGPLANFLPSFKKNIAHTVRTLRSLHLIRSEERHRHVPRFPRNRCLLDVGTCRRFHETASNPLYRQHYEVKLNTFANIQHILLCWIPVFHDSPYHVVHMDYLVGSRHGT